MAPARRVAHPALHACGKAYFFPRPFCPFCSSKDVEWFTASGRGKLYSYVINQRAAPGFQNEAPYVIAVVELDEGPRMMTNIVGVEPTPENLPVGLPVEVTSDGRRRDHLPHVPPVGARREPAHERRDRRRRRDGHLGILPDKSALQLHAEAARNAIADAGLAKDDVDAVLCAGQSPVAVAEYLGIRRVHRRHQVGGCSFMIHVRHAAAAIEAGPLQRRADHARRERPLPRRHGRLGRRGRRPAPVRGALRRRRPADALHHPHCATCTSTAPPRSSCAVAVATRRWAEMNPRAMMRDPITVEDVLNSRMIAWPLHLLECCLVTDGGGALVVARRARPGLPEEARLRPRHGRGAEHSMISQMHDFTESRAFKVPAERAFGEAGIERRDIDHLMLYDAFAHAPMYGLEALGFSQGRERPVLRGDAHGARRRPPDEHQRRRALLHAHRHVRHVRAPGDRPAAPRRGGGAAAGRRTSIAHGVGGMFHAAGTLILTNDERA